MILNKKTQVRRKKSSNRYKAWEEIRLIMQMLYNRRCIRHLNWEPEINTIIKINAFFVQNSKFLEADQDQAVTSQLVYSVEITHSPLTAHLSQTTQDAQTSFKTVNWNKNPTKTPLPHPYDSTVNFNKKMVQICTTVNHHLKCKKTKKLLLSTMMINQQIHAVSKNSLILHSWRNVRLKDQCTSVGLNLWSLAPLATVNALNAKD